MRGDSCLYVHEVVFNDGDVDEQVVRTVGQPAFLTALLSGSSLPEWLIVEDVYGETLFIREESIGNIRHRKVCEVHVDAVEENEATNQIDN